MTHHSDAHELFGDDLDPRVDATGYDAEQKRRALMAPPLTFDRLRQQNIVRLPRFVNAYGEHTHTLLLGADWSANDWMTALTGEVGEAANILKKVRRGDTTMNDARNALADEIADAQTYLDLLALRCGIDLGEATRRKWNDVSDRIGAPDLRL